MHTDRIMRLALEMAGLTEVPEDTQVYVPGEITKALVCIDADTAPFLASPHATIPRYARKSTSPRRRGEVKAEGKRFAHSQIGIADRDRRVPPFSRR